jgi:hypothetical protein
MSQLDWKIEATPSGRYLITMDQLVLGEVKKVKGAQRREGPNRLASSTISK